jgi:exosortase
MSDSVELTAPVPETKSKAKANIRLILGISSLAGVWGMLIYQLQLTWSLNDQYSHGFIVPILCLYLALKTKSKEENDRESSQTSQSRAWLYIGIPCLLALLPLWVIREANSDWRMLNVALFICAASFSFALAYDQGGFNRAKMLAFPILFFLVAIPWPLATDLQLTQWLQGRVSSLIVNILLLMGHEVRLLGNVIDIGVFGQVGVDEACSGIHGLQASLVVSLFLGFYYRLGIIHRIIFCLAGVVVALSLNLLRAFSLTFVKIKGYGNLLNDPLFSLFGQDAPSLHDLAGWIESGGILIVLFILARMAGTHNHRNTEDEEHNDWENLKVSPPIGFGIGACIWVILIFAATHLHYDRRESSMEKLPRLITSFTDQSIVSEQKPISSLVEAQLHYEDAQSVAWQERSYSRTNPYDGTSIINTETEYWQGFQCSWKSGGACTSILSTHSPDACLPLTGLVQVHPQRGRPPEIISVPLGNYHIPFESYEFAQDHNKLHVFRCFWPHKHPKGGIPSFPASGYDFTGRLQAAIEGRRNVGGTMLALCVANVASHDEAIAKLHRQVKKRLLISDPPH